MGWKVIPKAIQSWTTLRFSLFWKRKSWCSIINITEQKVKVWRSIISLACINVCVKILDPLCENGSNIQPSHGAHVSQIQLQVETSTKGKRSSQPTSKTGWSIWSCRRPSHQQITFANHDLSAWNSSPTSMGSSVITLNMLNLTTQGGPSHDRNWEIKSRYPPPKKRDDLQQKQRHKHRESALILSHWTLAIHIQGTSSICVGSILAVRNGPKTWPIRPSEFRPFTPWLWLT